MDIEIPLGKRTKKYRFFEMLPGVLSYGAIILLVVLSILSPVLASIYLLSIILAAFVKAIAISYRVISGYSNMEKRRESTGMVDCLIWKIRKKHTLD